MAMMWPLLSLRPSRSCTTPDGSAGWSAYGTKQSSDRCCHAVELLSPLEPSWWSVAAVRSARAFVCNSFRVVVGGGDAAVLHVASTDRSMMRAHFSIGFVCS